MEARRQLFGLVFFFYFYMGSRSSSKIVRLVQQALSPDESFCFYMKPVLLHKGGIHPLMAPQLVFDAASVLAHSFLKKPL